MFWDKNVSYKILIYCTLASKIVHARSRNKNCKWVALSTAKFSKINKIQNLHLFVSKKAGYINYTLSLTIGAAHVYSSQCNTLKIVIVEINVCTLQQKKVATATFIWKKKPPENVHYIFLLYDLIQSPVYGLMFFDILFITMHW